MALLGASRAAVANDLGLVLLPEIDADSTGADLADGVIVIDPPRRSPSVARLRKEGVPLVTIGTDPSAPDDPWAVIADNETNCRSVLDRLRAGGAQRIALITCDEPWGWFIRNDAAYRGWSGDAGVEATTITAGPTDRDGAREATTDLLAGAEPPDAVLALTEDSAIGAVDAARAAGLEVPADFQVASLVDGSRLRAGNPGITSFDLDPVAQAEAAVDLLLTRIRGEEPPGPVVVGGRLIERETTNPAGDGE
jgi:DNA-binding LacI/PurR family transcriptional regulator